MFRKNLADQSVHEIRANIVQSRIALGEKGSAWQRELRGEVENIQQMAEAKLASIKKSFTIGHQVSKNPWAGLAGSIFAGFVLQRVIGSGPKQEKETPHGENNGRAEELLSRSRSKAAPSELQNTQKTTPLPTTRGLAEKMLTGLSKEIRSNEKFALGFGVGLLQAFAKHTLPKVLHELPVFRPEVLSAPQENVSEHPRDEKDRISQRIHKEPRESMTKVMPARDSV